MTLCFFTTLAVQLDFVSPLALYLNFHAIYHNYQVRIEKSLHTSFSLLIQSPQIWRLLTTFFFFDYFNLNFVFHMFFTYVDPATRNEFVSHARTTVCSTVNGWRKDHSGDGQGISSLCGYLVR